MISKTLAVALGLALAADASARAEPLPPGNHTRPLPFERLPRSYVLHLPPAAAKDALVPLGRGHDWPGKHRGPLPESVMGPHTDVISAAEEAWKFFARFELSD